MAWHRAYDRGDIFVGFGADESASSYYLFAASPDNDLSANDALERAKDVASTLLPITAALALAIIVGAWKMLRLTSPRWAIAAAVLALLPLPAGPLWLASLPIGIWALVVLSKPGVKRGFKLQKQRTTRKQNVRRAPAKSILTSNSAKRNRPVVQAPLSIRILEETHDWQ